MRLCSIRRAHYCSLEKSISTWVYDVQGPEMRVRKRGPGKWSHPARQARAGSQGLGWSKTYRRASHATAWRQHKRGSKRCWWGWSWAETASQRARWWDGGEWQPLNVNNSCLLPCRRLRRVWPAIRVCSAVLRVLAEKGGPRGSGRTQEQQQRSTAAAEVKAALQCSGARLHEANCSFSSGQRAL
jgi:hypothetical protein